MKIVAAVAFLLLLVSCNRQKPDDGGQAMALAAARADILTLQTDRDNLTKRVEYLEKYVGAISKDMDSISNQVSANAKTANDNALRDMTAAGVCGQETYVDAAGVTRAKNRTCTKADMRAGN